MQIHVESSWRFHGIARKSRGVQIYDMKSELHRFVDFRVERVISSMVSDADTVSVKQMSGTATGVMLGIAVAVLALPSAVLALSTSLVALPGKTAEQLKSFTSTAADAKIAAATPVRSLAQGHPFQFTPAGTATRPDRSVTVAIRVDPQTARSIIVRGTRYVERPAVVASAPQVPIASTAFNLGVSRGFQSFAKPVVASPKVQTEVMPDLASFSVRGNEPAAPRFSPHIAVDDKEATGRAPRTFAGDKDPSVELGGAYRVTRNLDVTAGVRYSQDRERLQSLTDGKQDNQAVYVGTQFRF